MRFPASKHFYVFLSLSLSLSQYNNKIVKYYYAKLKRVVVLLFYFGSYTSNSDSQLRVYMNVDDPSL